jgi:hypothetical protein
LFLTDRPGAERLIESYFGKLDTMKNGPNIGARLRFMVEDVCDFRASGWKPGKGGPKAVLRGAKSAKEPAKNDEKASPVKNGTPAGAGGAGAVVAARGAQKTPDSQWKEVSKAKPQGAGKQGNKQDSPAAKDRKDRGKEGGKDGKRGGKDETARRGNDRPASGSNNNNNNNNNTSNNAAANRGDRNSGGRGATSSPASAAASKDARKEVATPSRADEEDEDTKPEVTEKSKDPNERYIPAVHSAIEEFWELSDIDGVIYAIEKDFPEDYRSQFIFEAFKHSLMRGEKDRERLLDCFFAPELTDGGIFTKAVLRGGIQLIVDALADLQMDHPGAARKLAPFIARSINEGVHTFKELWSLFDQHIEEGRGFGVCGEVLGATLKCLSQSSSIEKIKELLVANHCTLVVTKLPHVSRTEQIYAKFLSEFGLVDCFPPLDKSVKTPPAGNSPVASAKGTTEYKKAEPALDEFGLVILAALQKVSFLFYI